MVPELPSFQMLQQQNPQSLQPSAPSGGANSPPVPVSQPGGMGLPTPPQTPPVSPMTPAPQVDPYIVELERSGRLPAGRFKTTQEAFEAIYGIAESAAQQVERLQSQTQAPPVEPAPPQAPAAPVEDLNKMAMAFQQSGWMALENGQWVAKQAAATQLAQQLNQRIAEAQARQAELADPDTFFAKYGKKAINENIAPLQAELAELKQQYQQMQQELYKAVPKPHEAWVKQNEAQLWTTNQLGQRVPSPAGKAYGDAWDLAQSYGMAAEDIHKFASVAATPYMTQQQAPPAVPQPQQSWMQQTLQNPPVHNPAFNAPGTSFTNSVPPHQRASSLDNDGLPSFQRLQNLSQ